MCNRVQRYRDWSETRIRLGFDDDVVAPNLPPSWNVAPTQDLLVAVHGASRGKRVPAVMRWGLIPGWSKDGAQPGATFNARSETIDTAPAFRSAWKAKRRCLIITDGFYEWKKFDPKGKRKQPYAIAAADGGLTVMAGLWDGWRSKSGSETIRSCTIITCEPNEAMALIHNRMPVILHPDDWRAWLGELEVDDGDLKALLRPCDPASLKIWPVGQDVGRYQNDRPDLLNPVELAA